MKEETATRSNKVIEKNILSLITLIGGEASLFFHSLINPDYTPYTEKVVLPKDEAAERHAPLPKGQWRSFGRFTIK
jgi:hypothetical protein